MADKTKGLLPRYTVSRLDGSDQPGGKHFEDDVFVLDLTHDPFAIPAIAAYIQACRQEFPFLADDLTRRHKLKIELWTHLDAWKTEAAAKEADLRGFERGLLTIADAAGVNEPVDIPAGGASWGTLITERIREAVQRTRLELVKQGQTEKLARFDRRKRPALKAARATRKAKRS